MVGILFPKALYGGKGIFLYCAGFYREEYSPDRVLPHWKIVWIHMRRDSFLY